MSCNNRVQLREWYVDDACRDLLEVCEAQLQFGTKAELPVFGGSRGPDISKSITDIQVSYVASQSSSNSHCADVQHVILTRHFHSTCTFHSTRGFLP